MSKYIIDTGDYLFTTDGVLVVGFDCDNKPATFYNSLDTLEELNSDYINEYYGELQDEAYQRGFTDGKTSAERGCDGCKHEHAEADGNPCRVCRACTRGYIDQYEPAPHSDRIEVGDEVISDAGTKYTVTSITGKDSAVGFSGRGLWCFNAIDTLKKTGKHYDIASILEAMRT